MTLRLIAIALVLSLLTPSPAQALRTLNPGESAIHSELSAGMEESSKNGKKKVIVLHPEHLAHRTLYLRLFGTGHATMADKLAGLTHWLNDQPQGVSLILGIVPETLEEAQQLVSLGLKPLISEAEVWGYLGPHASLRAWPGSYRRADDRKGYFQDRIIFSFPYGTDLRLPGLPPIQNLYLVPTQGTSFQNPRYTVAFKGAIGSMKTTTIDKVMHLVRSAADQLSASVGIPYGLAEAESRRTLLAEMEKLTGIRLAETRVMTVGETREWEASKAKDRHEAQRRLLIEKLAKEGVILKVQSDLQEELDHKLRPQSLLRTDLKRVRGLQEKIRELTIESLVASHFRDPKKTPESVENEIRAFVDQARKNLSQQIQALPEWAGPVEQYVHRAKEVFENKDWGTLQGMGLAGALGSAVLKAFRGGYPEEKAAMLELDMLARKVSANQKLPESDEIIRTWQAQLIAFLAAKHSLSEETAIIFLEDPLASERELWLGLRHVGDITKGVSLGLGEKGLSLLIWLFQPSAAAVTAEKLKEAIEIKNQHMPGELSRLRVDRIREVLQVLSKQIGSPQERIKVDFLQNRPPASSNLSAVYSKLAHAVAVELGCDTAAARLAEAVRDEYAKAQESDPGYPLWKPELSSLSGPSNAREWEFLDFLARVTQQLNQKDWAGLSVAALDAHHPPMLDQMEKGSLNLSPKTILQLNDLARAIHRARNAWRPLDRETQRQLNNIQRVAVAYLLFQKQMTADMAGFFSQEDQPMQGDAWLVQWQRWKDKFPALRPETPAHTTARQRVATFKLLAMTTPSEQYSSPQLRQDAVQNLALQPTMQIREVGAGSLVQQDVALVPAARVQDYLQMIWLLGQPPVDFKAGVLRGEDLYFLNGETVLLEHERLFLERIESPEASQNLERIRRQYEQLNQIPNYQIWWPWRTRPVAAGSEEDEEKEEGSKNRRERFIALLRRSTLGRHPVEDRQRLIREYGAVSPGVGGINLTVPESRSLYLFPFTRNGHTRSIVLTFPSEFKKLTVRVIPELDGQGNLILSVYRLNPHQLFRRYGWQAGSSSFHRLDSEHEERMRSLPKIAVPMDPIQINPSRDYLPNDLAQAGLIPDLFMDWLRSEGLLYVRADGKVPGELANLLVELYWAVDRLEYPINFLQEYLAQSKRDVQKLVRRKKIVTIHRSGQERRLARQDFLKLILYRRMKEWILKDVGGIVAWDEASKKLGLAETTLIAWKGMAPFYGGSPLWVTWDQRRHLTRKGFQGLLSVQKEYSQKIRKRGRSVLLEAVRARYPEAVKYELASHYVAAFRAVQELGIAYEVSQDHPLAPVQEILVVDRARLPQIFREVRQPTPWSAGQIRQERYYSTMAASRLLGVTRNTVNKFFPPNGLSDKNGRSSMGRMGRNWILGRDLLKLHQQRSVHAGTEETSDSDRWLTRLMIGGDYGIGTDRETAPLIQIGRNDPWPGVAWDFDNFFAYDDKRSLLILHDKKSNSRVAGFLAFRRNYVVKDQQEGQDEWLLASVEIDNMILDPDYRNSDTAPRALISDLQLQFPGIALIMSVRNSDLPAKRLLRRLGFMPGQVREAWQEFTLLDSEGKTDEEEDLDSQALRLRNGADLGSIPMAQAVFEALQLLEEISDKDRYFISWSVLYQLLVMAERDEKISLGPATRFLIFLQDAQTLQSGDINKILREHLQAYRTHVSNGLNPSGVFSKQHHLSRPDSAKGSAAGMEERNLHGFNRREFFERTVAGAASAAMGGSEFLAEELSKAFGPATPAVSEIADAVMELVAWLGHGWDYFQRPELFKNPQIAVHRWERQAGNWLVHRNVKGHSRLEPSEYPARIGQEYLGLLREADSLADQWSLSIDQTSGMSVPASIFKFYYNASGTGILANEPNVSGPVSLDQLVDFWCTSTEDWIRIGVKTGAERLGADKRRNEQNSAVMVHTRKRLERLNALRDLPSEQRSKIVSASLRARSRYLKRLSVQAEPLVKSAVNRLSDAWISRERNAQTRLFQSVDQILQRLDAAKPQSTVPAYFVGLSDWRQSGSARERLFIDDWILLGKIQRENKLPVRLLRKRVEFNKSLPQAAAETAVQIAESGFRGNLGIALPPISWERDAEEILMLEWLAETLALRFPGLQVSFVITFKESMKRAQRGYGHRVPSYTGAFLPWWEDPVFGVMHVLPGLTLPYELLDRFENEMDRQAQLKEAA